MQHGRSMHFRCNTRISRRQLKTENSFISLGTLAIETGHAAQLSRHQSGWMTWTSNSLKLAWLGFSDLHSGVDHYIVTLGSQPFYTDINKDGVPANIAHTSGGADKGDEGMVQTAEVLTENVVYKQSVFVAIWAVNGVGLKSDPYLGEVILEGDAMLWLVRRCRPYNCEGQCVCAVQDGACAVSQGCTPRTTVDGAVNDVIDLTFPPDPSDVDFSPLDTVMAASWSVTQSPDSRVQRYEYSIGDCDEAVPQGVFDIVTERIWFEAGQETKETVSLPKGRSLPSGTKLCFFVRAWYDFNSYSTLKSNGVTIHTTPPSVVRTSAYAVNEYINQAGTKDVDYQTDRERIYIGWTKLFPPGHSGILKYAVYISTTPGGHSIHKSGDLTTTSYTATGLSLESDTVYYSSVLAYNKAGLVSWAYSDGVQVDVDPPVAGKVHDGQEIHDVDYQSSATTVSASWYGFSDSDSAIVKYYWCVGTTNDTSDCSVLDWQDTGLHTSFKMPLQMSVTSGTTIWSKVYAVDVVGHTSDTAVSDGVTIDVSLPEPQTVAFLGENLLQNPSFEIDPMKESSTNCSVVTPSNWDTDTDSCIKIISPESPIAKHGDTFVSVSGTIQQTVTGLDIGRQYKLTLHTGYPQTVNSQHRPVVANVVFAGDVHTFELDPNLCKGTCQVGDHSVILWNTHTYRFTAKETTSVLKISSASRTMEFVLDHVSLQTVDYGSGSGDTENHLVVHPVFLSHWSSLHVSWHFLDQQSPITGYKWAIGTVRGGTQLQGYRDVGTSSQSAVVDLQLSHNSTVYISVLATNAAGLTTMTQSDPVTVDLTPPKFDYIRDGPVWDDDYQSSSLVVVNWQVTDVESGIDHCDWAIGLTRGRSDINKYERIAPGQSTAEHDISNILDTNPITVYTTVRCFNKVGLVSAATTDGVTVILESTVKQSVVPGFGVLEEGTSLYSQRGICHQSQNKVRLHWNHPDMQMKAVVVGLERENTTYQHSISNNLQFTSASLTGLKLRRRSLYQAFSFPVDVLGASGETTNANVTVLGNPPTISTSEDVSLSREGAEVTLEWSNVFISPWSDLYYEVQIGSTEGGADVVDRVLTREESVKLTLNPPNLKVMHIYVSIAAIDPCGLTAFYSKKIRFNTGI